MGEEKDQQQQQQPQKDVEDTHHLSSWFKLTAQAAKLVDRKATVLEYWKRGTRPDGRLFAQVRPTTCRTGILTRAAAGSAWVVHPPSQQQQQATTTPEASSTATTSVLAAVTWHVGQPTTSTSTSSSSLNRDTTQGAASSNASSSGEITVILDESSQPLYHQNPGSGGSLGGNVSFSLLQAFLQRTLEDTLHPSLSELIPGRAALGWVISVQVLEVDSSSQAVLQDVALAACVAAWLDALVVDGPSASTSMMTTLPSKQQFVWDEATRRVWLREEDHHHEGTTTEKNDKQQKQPSLYDENLFHLAPVLPVSLSMGQWLVFPTKDDDATTTTASAIWVVDPTADEQDCLYNQVTVTVNLHAPHKILGLDMSVSSPNNHTNIHHHQHLLLQPTDVALAMRMAQARAREWAKILLPQQQQSS